MSKKTKHGKKVRLGRRRKRRVLANPHIAYTYTTSMPEPGNNVSLYVGVFSDDDAVEGRVASAHFSTNTIEISMKGHTEASAVRWLISATVHEMLHLSTPDVSCWMQTLHHSLYENMEAAVISWLYGASYLMR